ncbi:MAG: glycosyltransferase [Gemmatimonadaceae bacterium]
MPDVPMLTVVIPTFRRPASLLRTLASLQEQDVALELIVVDNAADESLRTSMDAFNSSARLPVRYVAEPRAGVHYARNSGAMLATSDVIAFTDDDVTFAPGWARAYAEAFAAHPGIAAAGGPSHADWESPPPAWLMSLVQRGPAFFQLSLRDYGHDLRLDETESFWSLNMAIRKSVLINAGGFNPELVGDRYVGDGEGGLFRTLRRAGKRVAYIPGALVHHRIPGERMTMAYLRHRMESEGAAECYARLRGRDHAPLALATRALASTIGAWGASFAARPLRASSGVFPLRVQLKAAELAGRAAYLRRAVTDGDLRQLIRQDAWL